MTVYIPWNTGLGDQVATISLLARRAEMVGEPMHLSNKQHGHDLGPLHNELFRVFKPTRVITSYLEGDTPLDGFNIWAAEPWQTHQRWKACLRHHYYVAQFDGVSSPEKNPSPQDIIAIGSEVGARYDMQGFLLGKKQTIDECVRLMTGAAFFVGCDSGMSHLAHCVGIPTFILEYGLPIVTTHRNKPYIHCAGAEDFLRNKLPAWASYRKFIGPGL